MMKTASINTIVKDSARLEEMIQYLEIIVNKKDVMVNTRTQINTITQTF